ncbi:MAG: hypothetical protein Q9221_002964 [Calogaya cf. arnoldii]
MPTSKQAMLALLTFAACSVLASPVPEPQTGGNTESIKCVTLYEVQDEHKKDDVAGITGDYTVSGGSELNAGSSFAVETSITVGADLGLALKEIVDAGVSASVSITEQKGTSQGATAPCPEGGDWKCALKIFPNIVTVSGEKVSNSGSQCPGPEKREPYTVDLPVLGDTKAVETRIEICACNNYPGADDEGSPPDKCDDCP